MNVHGDKILWVGPIKLFLLGVSSGDIGIIKSNVQPM